MRSRDGVWYADCHYHDGRKFVRRERSTRIRDDGTRQSKRTAEAVGRTIEAQLQASGGRSTRETSLAAAFAARLDELELKDRSAATKEIVLDKAVYLYRFFGRYFGCDGADVDVTRIDDAAMLAYAMDARTTRAAATVEMEFIQLRAAARCVGVQLPKAPEVGKKRIVERWLDTEETRKLLAYMRSLDPKRRRGTPKYDHVIMYRYMGLTYSELYRIGTDDIDWTRNEVRVRGTKRESRDRVIPMPPAVREILHRRFVDSSVGFERWRSENMNRDLTMWCRACGVIGPNERLSANDLRRSFATELVSKGASTKFVADLMGHVDEKMVNRIYARVATGKHMHETIALLHTPER